jgi:ArsR family transcriptional regulator, arsenate/arsenite/antimonite-responsive transcriptional repressor / arsenate reductase (thioredoxin)
LFVCTGNSARSPVAAALLHSRGAGRLRVASAGTRPKPRMHPNAVRVLRERYGIDIADQRPGHVDTVARHRFDYVITLCDNAREVCPDFSNHTRLLHWSIRDPAKAGDTDEVSYPGFERTAADIDSRIRYLLPVLTYRNPREITP